MSFKILLKTMQLLLEDHKCETCKELLFIFRPYKIASNAEHQQTWYQNNKEKHANYYKHKISTSEYQESHNKKGCNK